MSAAPANLVQWAVHSPEEVQRALANKGFNPGPIDGQWGKKSINALKAFQRANGLEPTGVFDNSATDILFPVEKKPVPATAKEVVTTTVQPKDIKPAPVSNNPKVKRTVIVEDVKRAAKKEVPEKAATPKQPKVQVIVEKVLASPAIDEAATSPAESKTSPLLAEGTEQLTTGWTPYVVVAGLAAVVLAFTLRRRRRSAAEPTLAGSGPSDGRNVDVPDSMPQRASSATKFADPITSLPLPSALQTTSAEPMTSEIRAAPQNDTDGGNLADEAARVPDGSPTVQDKIPDYRDSLAAHNRSIDEFVRNNRVIDADGQSVAGPHNRDASERPMPVVVTSHDRPEIVASRSIGAEASPITTLPISGVSGAESPIGNGAVSQKPFFGTARRSDGGGPLSLIIGGRNSEPPARKGNDCWVPPGQAVSIAGISFDAGLVYVGSYLPRQNASQESENCLIDPRLKVGSKGDPYGNTMGYWPSYARITPEARRSYLLWLAGGRDQPDAYIGYVFLYFYGLERRLMLDGDHGDGAIVRAEVERLLSVYGGSNSFSRYAHELLSAYVMKVGTQLDGRIPDVDGNGYDVPMPIKLALGVRIRDGRPFEPDLLMKFALSHPETKVRTPARRAPELLRELFADEMNARYPQGMTIKAGRFKKLKVTYRACSGSFTLDVAASDGSIPDISDRAEPITTARTIFEACSDKLDEYSRALGQSPGLQPTLGIVSKLPGALRAKMAGKLAGNPLATLVQLAETGRPLPLSELLQITSFELGNSIGRTKLKEMSQLLASFGLGSTTDPAYALRLPVAGDPVLVFRISSSQGDASEAYRSAQLSAMLGMMIGHADGEFAHSERLALEHQLMQNPNLVDDERVRLKAELAISELNPSGLDEWSKRLKDLSAPTRTAIAAELVVIAAADGKLHSAEIKKLEGLYKRMGMDPQSLYALLHESGSKRRDDDDLALIVPPGEVTHGIPIPRPPAATTSSIDVNRLMAIRNETIATTIILEGILGDVEETVEVVMPEPELIEDGGIFDGLELRYNALVAELRSQSEWSRADFETLASNASLMPGAALIAINEWSLERFDELLIEGDDPLTINAYILPSEPTPSPGIAERLTT